MTLRLAWIDDDEPLPPTRQALGADSEAPGLLAAGGQVTPARLEEAYSRGIFPWYSPGQPVLWWSPDPRMVLQVANFRLHRSLAKVVRRFVNTSGCEIRFDHSFTRVMQACSEVPRQAQAGTWIVPDIIAAYSAWHRAGRAHSVETWVNGELVGGLYGVCLGRMFYGESMFAHATDASKIALAALVCFCREHGIEWIDCQQNTGHLASLGAAEVPRVAFEQHLSRALGERSPRGWAYDRALWRHLGVLTPARSP